MVYLVIRIDYDSMASMREDPEYRTTVGYAETESEAAGYIERALRTAKKYGGYRPLVAGVSTYPRFELKSVARLADISAMQEKATERTYVMTWRDLPEWDRAEVMRVLRESVECLTVLALHDDSKWGGKRRGYEAAIAALEEAARGG